MMRGLVLLCLFGGMAQAAPVTFGDSLYAKFHHDRCLQCHQFNSREHDGRAFTSHRSRYLCKQCHVPTRIGLRDSEWMAPEPRFDYTGLSAGATCRLLKQNMRGDDRRILDHLLHDGRVRWAIESGRTPVGAAPRVPGGLAEWERDVMAWYRDGMRCD
jgi:hypothetical protein